jgi:hypothetical protein
MREFHAKSVEFVPLSRVILPFSGKIDGGMG